MALGDMFSLVSHQWTPKCHWRRCLISVRQFLKGIPNVLQKSPDCWGRAKPLCDHLPCLEEEEMYVGLDWRTSANWQWALGRSSQATQGKIPQKAGDPEKEIQGYVHILNLEPAIPTSLMILRVPNMYCFRWCWWLSEKSSSFNTMMLER